MFCEIKCENRVERLSLHFLEKNCSKLPEHLLNQYIIDYMSNHKAKKPNQNKNHQIISKENEFDKGVLNEIWRKIVDYRWWRWRVCRCNEGKGTDAGYRYYPYPEGEAVYRQMLAAICSVRPCDA